MILYRQPLQIVVQKVVDQTQFSPKTDSRKSKKDLILLIIFAITPTDGWCY